jgi:translation initiation factor IF-1
MAVTTDIRQQVFDLLTRASNLSFVTAEQEGGSVTALTPGQRVNAEVLSMLPNNRVQVRVGADRFNLDLPMAVRVGQNLEMTFVSADPRSTFAITRQLSAAPPVTLSDASRLLSLLVSQEKIIDPQLRASLQSIGTMLRNSSGEASVLANLLDETLTYGIKRDGPATAALTGKSSGVSETGRGAQDQARLATFEAHASGILKNIAHDSRYALVEAANQTVTPLPFLPGEEVHGTVVGTLPGGRAFVQIAGQNLELQLPVKTMSGEILRLTFLSGEPKPSFALFRAAPDASPPVLSHAGRWLSVLEHSEGGASNQQMYVLERLNTVLKSLPPDSPAFTAIQDEPITYQTVMRGQAGAEQSAGLQAASMAAHQSPVTVGSGIVLNDDMARLLQAVIKGDRLSLLETLNQQAVPNSFMPGQQMKGEVLAALGGGRFMVQVAGQNLEFLLPKGVSRGDRLNLFFITGEPKQTFLMARFGRSGEAQVSDTGRWLSGFLGEAAGQASLQTTLGILRTLLAEPTTDATLLGRMLQQGLRESGLFYESHLARWFGGEYRLEDILKEPQGRLSPRLSQTAGHAGLPVDEFVRASARAGSTEVMEAIFAKAGASMAHEGIADQRTLPTVNEQLTSLQNGHLLFRGDLFPGQPFEWTVAERGAGRNRVGERERNWETGITISLPLLGSVTVRLGLDGTRVAVAVTAENSLSVPFLEMAREQLTVQLEGAGLTPTEMRISHAKP